MSEHGKDKEKKKEFGEVDLIANEDRLEKKERAEREKIKKHPRKERISLDRLERETEQVDALVQAIEEKISKWRRKRIKEKKERNATAGIPGPRKQ